MKIISLSVINDLATDNRVHKVAETLKTMGFSPILVGRVLPGSPQITRDYATRRMKLLFTTGPLFYLEYNIRLFFWLLKSRPDVLVANDLDTLAANYLVSVITRKPLIYDSHEYFTEVPELVGREFVKSVWSRLEKMLVPRVDAAYTVCASIANVYKKMYGVDFKVVRNLPTRANVASPVKKNERLPKLVLYQGALNLGRGIEISIEAMRFVEGAQLWIAGDGDLSARLKQQVVQSDLNAKVKFLGRLPLEQLAEITRQADLGISLEEDLGLSYRYVLPNKLFDYIQVGVPVLVSDLPEMRMVVEGYRIGLLSNTSRPEDLAKLIETALFDDEKRDVWMKNLPLAADVLCWENEEKILIDIYSPYL